jgi:xanthine dehydrogenase accessory factor
MRKFADKIRTSLDDPRASALCIVTGNSGSVPGKVGAKMIVFSDGSIEGTVGGGSVEKRTIEEALTIMETRVPQLKVYNLQSDLGMACGGEVSIYIEPLSKPSRLYVFGAGHIGKILARLASEIEFETTLIDWRTDLFDTGEAIRYRQVIKPYLEAIDEISFDSDCYIVIVTPGHVMDEEVLAAVGKKEAAYLGLIGSKRKIEALKTRFLAENILTEAELNRVDMPIGIQFNAITPAEIAISILARLIDTRNNLANR